MATIKMPDNQSFELEDEIAASDDQLRAALAAAYPDAANATFERAGKDGKPLVVKVVKKAGTKGAHLVVTDLLAAPVYVNPAVEMQQEIVMLGDVSHLQVLALKPRIDKAVRDGEADLKEGYQSEQVLKSASAVAGGRIPMGF